MATNRTSPQKGKVVDIPDATITIGTPTAGDSSVSIAFTTASSPATGGPVQKYTAISSPGSFTASASTSPVVVTGLTNGTAYTFTVAAANATGNGVFSSASASATPVVVTSFESIATVSVGSGGQSTISFTSISSTYKHLQIRGISRTTGTANAGGDGDWIRIRFNSDTANNYARHYIQGNGSNTFSGSTSTTSGGLLERSANGNSLANNFGALIIDILDYTSTNKNKTVYNTGGIDNNGGGQMYFTSSLWYATPAVINSITLIPENGSFAQYSSFALYGIKG